MITGLSKRYDSTILGHPKKTLFALLLILLFFSYHVRNFTLDASADSLLLEDDKDLKIFLAIIDRYSIKEFLFITFAPHDNLFSQESLRHLQALRDELKALKRVDSVITLLDIPLYKTSGITLSEITDSTVKTLETPGTNYEKAKKEILESPLFRDLILSSDGQTTGIKINLKSDTQYKELLQKKNLLLSKKRSGTFTQAEEQQLESCVSEYEEYDAFIKEQRHEDIKRIRSIIDRYKKHAVIHLGGVPMIADDMISFIRNDLIVFGFGVFLFIVVTLAIIFREIRWVVLPLLSCFFAVIIMIGMLGLLNWKVTVLSSNFISLMLILTMSMNIHLAVRYRQLCKDMPSETQPAIVSLTAKKMVLPCLYTALTTILAFSSLVFSGIKPVIDFGWMMTIGLCVTFGTSFLLFPAILVLLKKSGSISEKERQSAVTVKLASIAERHGGKVIVLSIVLALVGIFGTTRLKVENSFINYFSNDTEIYEGLKLMDDKLGGTMLLDVILDFKVPETDTADNAEPEDDFGDEDDFSWFNDYDPRDYWLTPFKIEQIKKVHDYLDSLPEVGKVLSLASVIRVVEQLNEGKEFDGLELGVLLKKVPEKIKNELVNPYISIDHDEARISLMILDSRKNLRRKELLERIGNDLINKLGFSEDRVTVSGLLVLYNNMLQSLFRSQILTLGIVMIGIAVMLLILFRSFLLSVIGLIPNILAVGIVLGIMGLMNIPLDLMTITIAAITMGIAIDNSIHYIYRFKEEFALNGNYTETLHLCHANVGKAILNTSVTIIFGFSILVLSNFIPTIYFGIFIGLAMFIALLAVLTLLPKLILAWKPFKAS